MTEQLQRIGVVVSTLNRGEHLNTLLTSLERQSVPIAELIVVDQSENDLTRLLCKRFEKRLPLTYVTSGRGLSLGRNVGLRALRKVDLVAIPDDDAWLSDDFLERCLERFAESAQIGAVSGRIAHPSGGSRMTFESKATELDEVTVWSSAIEPALVFRKAALDDIGGFREDIGAGAPTPWQSGEGTELLLRLLAKGFRVAYEPRMIVLEDEVDGQYVGKPYRLKTLRYGRGTGFVARETRAPARVLIRQFGGPVIRAIKAALRRDLNGLRLSGAQLRGRLEGFLRISRA